ncbi:MAG: class I SAM-dependent methyltransferase [Paludibacter sp.]
MGYNWDYLDKKAYNNKVGHYKFRHQYQFILENGKTHFDKILDIAGGSGRFALPLRDYSEHITVLDLNPFALELLKERDNSIEIINVDFTKKEINDTFSLILCIEAIGNFQDWELFFQKVNKLLNDDGRLIFSYTNPSSWRFYLRKIKHWKKGFHPYKEMELTELKALLSKCNFEIEKMDGMNWIPLPLSSNSIFVSFFEFLENTFKLKNWHAQSPWLMISLKKRRI